MKTTSEYFDLRTGAIPEFKNPKQYIEAKIKILRRDFRISPTTKEMNHLYELKTRGDIDRAMVAIVHNHWG